MNALAEPPCIPPSCFHSHNHPRTLQTVALYKNYFPALQCLLHHTPIFHIPKKPGPNIYVLSLFQNLHSPNSCVGRLSDFCNLKTPSVPIMISERRKSALHVRKEHQKSTDGEPKATSPFWMTLALPSLASR